MMDGMTNTQTTFHITGHTYTDEAHPETCTNARHWRMDGGEYDTLADAHAALHMIDFPAIRITKVTTVTTTEVIETTALD